MTLIYASDGFQKESPYKGRTHYIYHELPRKMTQLLRQEVAKIREMHGYGMKQSWVSRGIMMPISVP